MIPVRVCKHTSVMPWAWISSMPSSAPAFLGNTIILRITTRIRARARAGLPISHQTSIRPRTTLRRSKSRPKRSQPSQRRTTPRKPSQPSKFPQSKSLSKPQPQILSQPPPPIPPLPVFQQQAPSQPARSKASLSPRKSPPRPPPQPRMAKRLPPPSLLLSVGASGPLPVRSTHTQPKCMPWLPQTSPNPTLSKIRKRRRKEVPPCKIQATHRRRNLVRRASKPRSSQRRPSSRKKEHHQPINAPTLARPPKTHPS